MVQFTLISAALVSLMALESVALPYNPSHGLVVRQANKPAANQPAQNPAAPNATTTATVGPAANAAATSVTAANATAAVGTIDPALVPEFGIVAGQGKSVEIENNCRGNNDVVIPCECPPELASFLVALEENVKAGTAVNNTLAPGIVQFPTGQGKADVLARLNAATITLQNLRGPGLGCPQASTTFGAQVQAAQALPN